ncbi:MAG: ZIP family metal transporter [Thermodesulfobacteriota bacterium]
MLAWIIIFSLLGSVGALLGAALVLLLPEKLRKYLVANLISYATGVLLGAVFLGLIPKALEKSSSPGILVWLLAGILFFFVMEKLILWRHCHLPECDVHASAGPLLLIGDAFHNFTDGVIIAGAFLFSIPLGIATGLAVVAHEIPQELGDFAILLESGYSRGRALIYNTVSALATLPGALLGYYFLGHMMQAVPYILLLGAASFLYIALVDLTPYLHRRFGLEDSLLQLGLILAGMGTIWLLHKGG